MDFPQSLPIQLSQPWDDDDQWLVEHSNRALIWLTEFPWVKKMESANLMIGYPGILVICDVSIYAISSKIDKRLWLISGDIPDAYLVRDDAKNAKQALSVYCDMIQYSIDCYLTRKKTFGEPFPVENLISKDFADNLQTRIKFIREILINGI